MTINVGQIDDCNNPKRMFTSLFAHQNYFGFIQFCLHFGHSVSLTWILYTGNAKTVMGDTMCCVYYTKLPLQPLINNVDITLHGFSCSFTISERNSPGIWPDSCPVLCTERSLENQKASLYCSPVWRTHPAPTDNHKTMVIYSYLKNVSQLYTFVHIVHLKKQILFNIFNIEAL